MKRKHPAAGHRLLPGGDIDEAENPPMGCGANDGEFAEIFVERNEYAVLTVGAREDLVIARVFCSITGPEYIMAICPQFLA